MHERSKDLYLGEKLKENSQEKIVNMFDSIAPTYDRANRVLSLGIDIKWRKKACQLTFDYANKKEISQIVDVACGTGDMMGHWDKIAKENHIHVKKIIGADPSIQMMEVGRKKFPDFEFVKAKADELPFESESTDIISISYGIRNVVQRQDALDEFHRILKPKGYVLILEFTKSQKKGFLYTLRDFYLKNILPIIGGIISKNKEAYDYLPNSIDGFLSTKKMQEELEEAGFKMLYVQDFSMDISTLFIAQKI
ncbi:MAG: bifunctional demethylmenaquinone methyltransferase/2-methoxy-6-polyprenyl-1,4-benzoquinol methylase UbiE [Proteobacteria bacterium]|nr:MAG: bifunctional demethylmenaquinone methyltransferase/2-methoxy-6-polyprenyl-1,4-benzoquinol methylase UbiE [Pseudomonadota bacterium]